MPDPQPSGPMTGAKSKALQQQVNTLLSHSDLNSNLDGMLFTSSVLCLIRYEREDHYHGKSNMAEKGIQQEPTLGEAKDRAKNIL